MKGKQILLIALALVAAASFLKVPEIHAASPTVTVTSVYNVTTPGTTFLVNITVTDVSDLLMWVMNLSWDPYIIQISTGDPAGFLRSKIRYNIYEGPFLKSIRGTIFTANSINNTGGTINSLSAGFLTPGTTASGSGVLAILNFTSIHVGNTTIRITGPSSAYPGHGMLIDHFGKEMAHEEIEGEVGNQGPPPPPPPPPFWTQLWFQVSAPAVTVTVLTGYLIAKVIIPARERARAREAQEVREDVSEDADVF